MKSEKMILRFVRSPKVQPISNTLRTLAHALSNKMAAQTFDQALASSIQDLINQQVSKQIQQMAASLEKETEGKVTAAQVVELWNKTNPAIPVNGTKAPTPGGRARKTDDRKCTFVLLSGPRKNEACGKACLIGAPGCTNHAPKMTAADASPKEEKKAAKPATKEAPNKAEKTPWDLTEAELNKLTVKVLKEFCSENKIALEKSDKKADIIAKVVAAQKKKAGGGDDEGDAEEEVEEDAEEEVEEVEDDE